MYNINDLPKNSSVTHAYEYLANAIQDFDTKNAPNTGTLFSGKKLVGSPTSQSQP
jgi:hypothetical protein